MTDRYLNISELFYSIQGESSWAGYPCTFIRLTGCNLRCSYCDSSYTWKEQGNNLSYEAVLDWLGHYPGVMVELTGGEPLLQDAVYPFLDILLESGRKVLIETNGSLSIAKIPPSVSVILDIKCPDSGMDDQMDWENINLLKKRQGAGNDIKFVLSSERDFSWSRKIVEDYELDKYATILFSPVEYLMAPSHLAELIMEYRLPVKLQLQLHRLLWPDVERGV